MKKILLSLVLGVIGVFGIFSSPVSAVTIDEANKACNGIGSEWNDITNEVCDTSDSQAGKVVIDVVNVVIAAVGLISVLFVVIGGVLFTTSQGDPAKVKRGKDTIMFALLGVILASLAFAIVNFVASAISSDDGSGGTSQQGN